MDSFIFYFTIFGSLISQVPVVLNSSLYTPLKLLWIVAFGFYLIKEPDLLIGRSIKFSYYCIIPFLLYCSFMHGITGHEYINIDFTNVLISLLVLVTSYIFFTTNGTERTMAIISKISMLCATILSLSIYVGFFLGYSMTSREYAYNDKNSASSILLSCITIGAISWKPSSNVWKIFKYSLITLITLFIIILKSRATFVGLFFLVGYIIVKTENKLLRWGTISVLLAIIAYIFYSPAAYNIVVEGIFMAGRDASNTDDLTSGRVTLISDALNIIPNNLLYGIGDSYIDCMPVSMLLQFGVIGASMIFIYLAIVIYKTFSFDRNEEIHLNNYLILVPLILNSLFEAKPPFGPGMKCFFIWMMLGFSLAYNEMLEDEKEENMYNIDDQETSA